MRESLIPIIRLKCTTFRAIIISTTAYFDISILPATCASHVCSIAAFALKASNAIDTTDNKTYQEICGDSRRFPFSECDDNNTISGDGCSSTCTE
jgi:cysteine-rich repeat protein